jgi:hypothetical protein
VTSMAKDARVRWIAQTSNRISNYEFSGMTPNCIGLLMPGIGLNTSFTHT